jgi:hypothetical protein
MIRGMRPRCLLACLAACTFAACTFSAPKLDADAAPGDGDGGGVWTVVEELTVPVRGEMVTSTVVLQAGVGYRLRASGTCYVALQTLGDAEYYDFPDPPVDGTVGGVDVGLAVNDSIIDGTRTPRWGAYSDTHVYEVEWMGNGAPIVAQFHDGNTSNNGGMLTLAILALR